MYGGPGNTFDEFSFENSNLSYCLKAPKLINRKLRKDACRKIIDPSDQFLKNLNMEFIFLKILNGICIFHFNRRNAFLPRVGVGREVAGVTTGPGGALARRDAATAPQEAE